MGSRCGRCDAVPAPAVVPDDSEGTSRAGSPHGSSCMLASHGSGSDSAMLISDDFKSKVGTQSVRH